MTVIKLKVPVDSGNDPVSQQPVVNVNNQNNKGGNTPLSNSDIDGVQPDAQNQHLDDGGNNNPDASIDDPPFTVDGLEQTVIDDEELYISPEGHVVNATGEQVYSSEEYDTIRANSNTVDVSLIERYSGIVLKDASGKPVQFDNTIQGVVKREQMIKEQIERDTKTNVLTEFFESNPVIKDVYQHYRKTGTVDTYKPSVDYNSIKLSADNPDVLESIILEAEIAKGNSPEKAQKLLDYYKADDVLLSEGKDAQKYLIDRKAAIDEKNQRDLEDRQRAQRDKSAKYFGVYYDDDGKEVIVNNEGSLYNTIVDKRKIGDFVIPENGISVPTGDGTTRNIKPRDIFNYISLAVNDEGHTQAQIDEFKIMSNSNNMIQRYLYNLTGGDLSMLIPQTIMDKRVKNVPRYKSPGTPKGGQRKPDVRKIKTPV